MGAGFLAFALRWDDRAEDGVYHLAFAIQMALLPPLYGAAHNAARPVWKGAILLFFAAMTAGAGFIYADLAQPREVPLPTGWATRPEEPLYMLPPAMLAAAWAILAGHWLVSFVGRLRRRRAA